MLLGENLGKFVPIKIADCNHRYYWIEVTKQVLWRCQKLRNKFKITGNTLNPICESLPLWGPQHFQLLRQFHFFIFKGINFTAG
jgi:hypothetical protein